MSRVQALRDQLVSHLQDCGLLRSESWRRAFSVVPRHVFIPRFVPIVDGEESVELDGSRPEQHAEWLKMAYRDVAAVTRRDETGWYTSSSSAPSVMIKMLELLHVEDDNDVLEIGTGTGYNAALLCERVGSEHVTSIDVQGDLIDEAEPRLKGLGYSPVLARADGAQGFQEAAPYDRLICTCAVWPIPVNWLGQIKSGGRIVAVVPDGCVGLDVGTDGSATGHFHSDPFNFMRMTPYMPPLPKKEDVVRISTAGVKRVRPYDYPFAILSAGGASQLSFEVLVSATLPTLVNAVNADMEPILMDCRDGSWTKVSWRTGEVTQGGPRAVWDEIEGLYEQWCRLGAPNRERFGLTVEPGGRHVLWLDHADSPHRWEVVPAP